MPITRALIDPNCKCCLIQTRILNAIEGEKFEDQATALAHALARVLYPDIVGAGEQAVEAMTRAIDLVGNQITDVVRALSSDAVATTAAAYRGTEH